MNITTTFSLKDRVHITELKTNGVVMAFYISSNDAIQYSVRYFKDNSALTTYFYDFELEAYKEVKKEVGFVSGKQV